MLTLRRRRRFRVLYIWRLSTTRYECDRITADGTPVETYVAEYNPGMIKEATLNVKQPRRQDLLCAYRVLGLENIAADLIWCSLPGINIRIAHGQMSEDMLEDAMIAFYEGIVMCRCRLRSSKWFGCALHNTIIIDGAENLVYRDCIRCAAG